MPKELADRRARCVEYMSRPSPAGSPCQSDNEDNEEGVTESVSALLSLVGQELGVCDSDAVQELEEFDEGYGTYGDEDDERDVGVGGEQSEL